MGSDRKQDDPPDDMDIEALLEATETLLRQASRITFQEEYEPTMAALKTAIKALHDAMRQVSGERVQ